MFSSEVVVCSGVDLSGLHYIGGFSNVLPNPFTNRRDKRALLNDFDMM